MPDAPLGMLTHEEFDEIFNPDMQPAPIDVRKQIHVYTQPDAAAATEYILISDDDDEDANDVTDQELWDQTGIPTPRPPILTQPPLGPSAVYHSIIQSLYI